MNPDPDAISLHGAWLRRLDPANQGRRERWFAAALAGEPHELPGLAGEIAPATGDLRGFAVRRPFSGTAWHQRAIDIPEAWRGRRIELYLERCQWLTRVWLDGAEQGACDSLVAPHIHVLAAAPGRHLLTIAVDNANRADDGVAVEGSDPTAHVDLTTEVKRTARLNCGGHHRYPHDWNGIIGRIELRGLAALHLAALRPFPRLADGTVGLDLRVRNAEGRRGPVAFAAACTDADGHAAGAAEWTLQLDGSPEQAFDLRLALAAPVRTWDEFSPHLYRLDARLDGNGRSRRFGMREVGRDGTRLLLNGRPVFLRGTLECFVFPLTGHPPADPGSWRRLLATARAYGLNHLRFHTCCPPEAAFAAADELGMYLQAELPGTSCPQRDEGPEVDAFLTAELERLLAAHGDHPSLLAVAMGNEQLIADDPAFVDNHQQVLERRVRLGQRLDQRHLYAATAHPWTAGRSDDLFISAWPVLDRHRLDALRAAHQRGEVPAEAPLCGIQWSGFGVVDASRFNTAAPETVTDYDRLLDGLDRPLLSHEVGQWASYPDLRELGRYHGEQDCLNFAVIREDLRRRGLLERAADFTRASGLLALALYKEEVESALRSARLSGFQLLGLHDYPGQGTSTIGLLNALWESKGLTTPQAFRACCGPVVALARLPARVWTAGQRLEAGVLVANHGPADLADATVSWRLDGEDGRILAQGAWHGVRLPCGGPIAVGTAGLVLPATGRAEALVLRVAVAGVCANAWNLWLYPDTAPAAVPAGIVVATRWDDAARAVLRGGGSLLLLPSAAGLREPVPGTFTPVFWNAQMKHAQPAKTMGLLIDEAHPCLDGFPTASHSDWQWWDPVMRSAAMRLDGLPAALRPAVSVIDAFSGNRRLALLFEAKAGAGRLLVCSIDLISDLAMRPVARQLRASILNYLAGPLFQPDVRLDDGQIEQIFTKR